MLRFVATDLQNVSNMCVKAPDMSCYVCGELTVKTQRRSLTPIEKKACDLHFGCKVGDQDKP